MIDEHQRLVQVSTSDREMTCIICPVGCRMTVERVDDGVQISGNRCKRGAEYAQEEFRDPRRVVTATCAIGDAEVPRLPVRSSIAVPVASLAAFLAATYRLRVSAPIAAGAVVGTDLANTGIDLIATMSVEAIEAEGGER